MLPKLIRELKGDVFAIMIFFVQFLFETLVYPLVFLTGSQIRRKAHRGEGSEKAQLLWLEELEERSEHFTIHLYLL